MLTHFTLMMYEDSGNSQRGHTLVCNSLSKQEIRHNQKLKLLLSSLIAVFEMGTFLLKIVSYEGTC